LFAIGNLPWQLDDYDQAKQAFTSFQMINEGRWLYQQTPHEQVATKPPLVGWVSAGLFALTHSWDLAWRLPSLIAAIGLAVLLFRSASSAYGRIAGLIALAAFGLNLLSLRLASLVRTDMALAFVIFVIGVLIWKKIRVALEWTGREQVYLFALLTIAMLIKGPIVYAFLLPGIVLFQCTRRRRAVVAGVDDPAQHSVPDGDDRGCSHGAVSPCGESRKERLGTARRLQSAWPGWWPWLASLGIFLVWVIGGIMFQPGFYDEVVAREFLGRFGETIHRPQPLYFYLPHLLHKFAPWSVLIIAIAIVDLHSRKWRLRSALREMSSDTLWLLCWSIGGLLVMSLIPSKRVDRIFPIVPPLCLLLAAQVAARVSCSHGPVGRPSTSVDSDSTAHRSAHWTDSSCGEPVATTNAQTRICRWSAAALVFAILFTGGYTIFKVASGYRYHRDALVIFGKEVRRQAQAHHWRYEVVSAKDEGLLLYLQKTHFIEPERATTEWNNGNLNALVASTEKAAGPMSQLQGATLSQLKSRARKQEQGTTYVLITR
ncbi:MAG TPA: glycosyltransferase family 39 protein, partial [Candidatus Udaeobacter sp.]|nr:glycosyltransferase family 39 protein [Candidatus Udaeobacter sp.]